MGAMSTKQRIGWLVITVVVLLWSLFPVVSILMTSFKTQAGLFSGKFLPPEWTWENYATILAPGGSAQDLFLPSLRNSIGISLISTVVAVVLATFRSEEHTSELQSRFDLVCRLLLEKQNSPIPDR